MTDMPNDTYQPETMNKGAAQSVLIMTADDTEDLEFFYPYYRFIEAGFAVDVVTPSGGKFAAKHGLGLKETKKITDVDAEDYDLLYLPGGKAPAKLMKNDDALALTKSFYEAKKPISAICHGPQILAAAKIIQGRKISAYPEVEKEITEAGGTYVSQECQTDGQFITARWPGDLPAHLKGTLAVMKGATQAKTKSAA